MRAIYRYLFYLLLVFAAGFAIYAAVADLPAPTRQVEIPAPPPALE